MTSEQPPVLAARPVQRTHHHQTESDPYEWVRDADEDEVLAHLTAENAYAEARTAHLAPLREQIVAEIRRRTQETDLSVPVASGPWWYYSRTREGQQYPTFCRAPRAAGEAVPDPDPQVGLPGEVVLLDANAEAEDHDFFAIGAFATSPDHERLVYSVDVTGDERFDVTVRDLGSGEVLDTSITGVGYGAAWSRDGRHLHYLRVDDAWRPHELWRHEIGADAAEDTLLHREEDERFWMGVDTSRDDRWVVLSIGSPTTSEVHLLDASDPDAQLRCVAPRSDGVDYSVEPAADHLLIVHDADDREGDLAWAPLDATDAAQWQPVLTRRPGERLLGADAYDDVTVLSIRRDGLPAVRLLPRAQHSTPFVPGDYGDPLDLVVGQDPLASVHAHGSEDADTDRIRITHQSWVQPRAVIDLHLASGEQQVLKRQRVLEVDLEDYEQRREWVSAPDGTPIPLSIVTRRGTPSDGTAPGHLYGYGSYEISLDPTFSIARLSLLDRGVVHAVAHVRGGGEMGRGWYEDGKMLAKEHSVTDLLACARHLHDTGVVARGRLGLEGGSAGGLLVGAAVNAEPDRFRAVLAAVPFVDPLTTILRPDLPLTVGEWEEWGNPLEDAEVYALMRRYSPYENVRAERYPAVLATTSLHDTRVSWVEPVKWVARLRASVTPDPERPVLLRTELTAGHGGRSGRYDAWEQTAWEWSWLLDQIGAGQLTPAGRE